MNFLWNSFLVWLRTFHQPLCVCVWIKFFQKYLYVHLLLYLFINTDTYKIMQYIHRHIWDVAENFSFQHICQNLNKWQEFVFILAITFESHTQLFNIPCCVSVYSAQGFLFEHKESYVLINLFLCMINENQKTAFYLKTCDNFSSKVFSLVFDYEFIFIHF